LTQPDCISRVPSTARTNFAEIRIAAVGDVHVGRDTKGFPDGRLDQLADQADLLLLAGDLTQHGYAAEALILARELANLRLPVVAVLGNHDYHQGEELAIRAELERAHVIVLEGESTVAELSGVKVGVGGVKGFGGGFAGACGSDFGESEMKAFMRHSQARAEALHAALADLSCDVKIAMTHYAPTNHTLLGERLEIYPFLGSYHLAEVIDRTCCAAAFHGHAHAGTERGITPGGVPVRNVARPVIKHAYKIYTLNSGLSLSDVASASVRSA
jgi:Icc-related predicted phosphoesterase